MKTVGAPLRDSHRQEVGEHLLTLRRSSGLLAAVRSPRRKRPRQSLMFARSDALPLPLPPGGPVPGVFK